MKIPYQDSRAGGDRRWTDYVRLEKVRFFEIYEIIERCNEFGKTELMELSRLIERKLSAFQGYPMDNNALTTRRESQKKIVSRRLPQAGIEESDKPHQNWFWRWFGKLASLGERPAGAYGKGLASEDTDCQNPSMRFYY